ncbi:MAG: type II toxin-antitoxin system RelE family toxin [Actinopolymorphaceae bacterium]
MKYDFQWSSHARRALRTLPREVAVRLLLALTPLGEDPRRNDADIKKMVGGNDRYRLRVGNYRVIYEIRDTQLIIWHVDVGHRRDMYRHGWITTV